MEPLTRYVRNHGGHSVDVIEWEDGGVTVHCRDCGEAAAAGTVDAALEQVEHRDV